MRPRPSARARWRSCRSSYYYYAPVPETDETLETPVMWAARNGHKETVRLLYENGADIEIKNFENERAIDFARIEGHGDIADMLQRWTRKKNKKRLLEMKRKSVIVTTPRDEDGDNDNESIRRMRRWVRSKL